MKKPILISIIFCSLMACGGIIETQAPCETSALDAAAPIPEKDASKPLDAAKDASSDTSFDSQETDSNKGPDCNGDHYRYVCLDVGSTMTAWGFEAECTSPYKLRPFVDHRLNGIEGCEAVTETSTGRKVLCCKDGG